MAHSSELLGTLANTGLIPKKCGCEKMFDEIFETTIHNGTPYYLIYSTTNGKTYTVFDQKFKKICDFSGSYLRICVCNPKVWAVTIGTSSKTKICYYEAGTKTLITDVDNANFIEWKKGDIAIETSLIDFRESLSFRQFVPKEFKNEIQELLNYRFPESESLFYGDSKRYESMNGNSVGEMLSNHLFGKLVRIKSGNNSNELPEILIGECCGIFKPNLELTDLLHSKIHRLTKLLQDRQHPENVLYYDHGRMCTYDETSKDSKFEQKIYYGTVCGSSLIIQHESNLF